MIVFNGNYGLQSRAIVAVITLLVSSLSASAQTMPHVDPELRAAVQALQQRQGTQAAASANRERPAMPSPQAPTQGNVVKRAIPGRNGAPDVAIHIINGGRSGARPAILHMHGGGYIMGSAAMSFPHLIPMSQALDCLIVSVDYRLAPATPFPGSLEDNYAALLWLYKNAKELGVDTSRIAVLGESAGGGHAVMLAIAARDRGEVPILFQALIYPMLDDRTGSTKQAPPHIGTLVWTAELNRRGWSALLGVPAGSDRVPEGAVPARIANISGLPPTYIAVGALDLFVEEDIAYAQRLINAGVPVELNVIPGAYHGFDILAPQASVTRRFRTALNNVLERAFTAASSAPNPSTRNDK